MFIIIVQIYNFKYIPQVHQYLSHHHRVVISDGRLLSVPAPADSDIHDAGHADR